MATKSKTAVKAVEVKTLDQLFVDLAAKKQDLIDAKKGHKQGELVNPHVLTLTRKEIARLHTQIRILEIAKAKEDK